MIRTKNSVQETRAWLQLEFAACRGQGQLPRNLDDNLSLALPRLEVLNGVSHAAKPLELSGVDGDSERAASVHLDELLQVAAVVALVVRQEESPRAERRGFAVGVRPRFNLAHKTTPRRRLLHSGNSKPAP